MITSIMALSSCQLFALGSSSTGGAPAVGLKVPGTHHLGYSRSSLAHSLRLTSSMSIMSRKFDRMRNPEALLGWGVTYMDTVSHHYPHLSPTPTELSNSRNQNSGHSSFLTWTSSLASEASPSNSITSGGTRIVGSSKGGDAAGSRSSYSR